MAKIKTIMDESGNSSPAPVTQPDFSEQEAKALAFIRDSLKGGRSPSVREICREFGFRSSRSGLLLVNKLINSGYLRRDQRGALELCKAIDSPRKN
jgi:SOS-response transcriptional repressor LexA